MWSMRSSATEGFTLSEMLLALGTAMLCSVLLTWMVRFFVIGIHTQQQLVQDQIAVLQLSSDDVVRHPLVQKIIDRYAQKGE